MARIEELQQILTERGAQWIEGNDHTVVDHFGDPRGEYEAITSGQLGIIERSERETLVLHGDDTIPWLQGLVTSDLHKLVDEGNGQRTSLVNTTGRFVAEARALHIPGLLVLDLEAGTLEGGLMSHLGRHIITEDVELDDRSQMTSRIGVYGVDAAKSLSTLTNWAHDLTARPPFAGSWGRWNGHDLIIQRVVWSEIPGFEITCAADAAPQVFVALENLDDNSVLFGEQTFETLRIEAGVPRFGRELHGKVIPLETSFDDAIDYEKGCYLGQEIIARLDTLGTPAKLLRRVILDGEELPKPKASIYAIDGGKRSIGHVESAVQSPRFRAPMALAFVKRKYNDVGNRVLIDGVEGRLEPLLEIKDLR